MRSTRTSRVLLLCGLACVVAACGKKEQPAPAAPQNEAASTALEGQVDIVAWPGYIERGESDKSYDWVRKFETDTGCKVNVKTAGTSDEMLSLMNQGGYDLVTASGDASLRLIRGGTVQPVDIAKVASYDSVDPRLKEAPWHYVDGKHYGVPYQWGPNVLMYNTSVFKKPPTSWSVVFEPQKLPDGKQNKGRVQAYDGPIYIADAALYLMTKKPDLGIKDPYELNEKQFQAAVDLLKQQKPLIKKYWSLASDEIDLFKSGDAAIGASWPYQTNTLAADKVPVKDKIPEEGATGWADTWMLSSKAKHPNCAYMWMKYISEPKPQAQQAIFFGETPANTKACAVMDKLSKGSAAQYHCGESAAYFDSIKFWKTPIADCGNGKQECKDYNEWTAAWQEIKG
jgi:putative spermidine/putrescine transport system substrate-binding protein